MNHIDKAMAILERTEDGNLLAQKDLVLVEGAVNGQLSKQGDAALEALMASVTDGSYFNRFRDFEGVGFLTRDARGFVYWKGVQVEHFSHRDREELAQASKALAARCLKLEELGFPVNSRTTLCPAFLQAPSDTPWQLAMLRYYTVMTRGDVVAGVFQRSKEAVAAGAAPVFAIWLEDSQEQVQDFEGGYESFHGMLGKGFESASCDISTPYERLAQLFQSIGVSPERLKTAIEGQG